jgi:hypothetical protein
MRKTFGIQLFWREGIAFALADVPGLVIAYCSAFGAPAVFGALRGIGDRTRSESCLAGHTVMDGIGVVAEDFRGLRIVSSYRSWRDNVKTYTAPTRF